MSDADTSTHHLMRVRIRTVTFERLQEIAAAESKRPERGYTSVSDLVRAALADYITVYETTSKLSALQSDPVRRTVG
jgi:hypothetical protein